MSLPLLPLQQALYQRLSAQLSTPVYDEPPVGATPPYVLLGEATVVDWSTKTSTGYEITHILHIWSAYAGMAEAVQMMADVLRAVATPLVIPGYAIAFLGPAPHRILRAPAGLRHGVLRLRFVMAETD